MSGEQGDLQLEVFIEAAPDAVFGFFVDSTLMKRWIGYRTGSSRARAEFSASRWAKAMLRAAITPKSARPIALPLHGDGRPTAQITRSSPICRREPRWSKSTLCQRMAGHLSV